MIPETTKDKIKFFAQFVTENRLTKMVSVLDERTRYITIVLENIFQSHNASAVMRSCDCFGIQDLHIIENKFRFSHHPDIEMGSSQWLSLHRYNTLSENTYTCMEVLKKNGYRIVATMPDEHFPSLNDLDLTKGKVALLFGTEVNGLTEQAIGSATEFVRIPMYGFTESLNLSVTAAICLHRLSDKIRYSGTTWHLTQEEKDEILIEWLSKKNPNFDFPKTIGNKQ